MITKKTNKLTDKNIEEIISLRNKKFSYSEIARKFGVDHTTILHHIKRNWDKIIFKKNSNEKCIKDRLKSPNDINHATDTKNATEANLAPKKNYPHKQTNTKYNQGRDYADYLKEYMAKRKKSKLEYMREEKQKILYMSETGFDKFQIARITNHNVKFVEWVLKKHNGIECNNKCSYQEPYGFVPEAGCPIHDI